MQNRSMPSCSVIPVLAYRDLAEAVEWLGRAFGFAERLRIGDHRAQLSIGPCAIVVTSHGATGERASSPNSIMVRIADADGHCERARAAGAVILSEPATFPYGERQYSAADLHGYVWTFSQTVEDVDPAAWGGVLREP